MTSPRRPRRTSRGKRHDVRVRCEAPAYLAGQLDLRRAGRLSLGLPRLRDDNFPEPALLQDMSRWDAAGMAPYHDLSFPDAPSLPSPALSTLALSILAALDTEGFATHGVKVSDCLWRGDAEGLKALAEELGRVAGRSPAAQFTDNSLWGVGVQIAFDLN